MTSSVVISTNIVTMFVDLCKRLPFRRAQARRRAALERERLTGLDPDDEAARWLREHDPPPEPAQPKRPVQEQGAAPLPAAADKRKAPGAVRLRRTIETLMCRSIHTLFNFEPAGDRGYEVRGAALQYVRKVSGFT